MLCELQRCQRWSTEMLFQTLPARTLQLISYNMKNTTCSLKTTQREFNWLQISERDLLVIIALHTSIILIIQRKMESREM